MNSQFSPKDIFASHYQECLLINQKTRYRSPRELAIDYITETGADIDVALKKGYKRLGIDIEAL